MSNYCFDIALETRVSIPWDQIINGLSKKHDYSKEEIESFLLNEIVFSAQKAISDRKFELKIDEEELSKAINLFFHDN